MKSSLKDRVAERLRERIPAEAAKHGDDPQKMDITPLFSHLDDVIQVVSQVHDYSTEPYMDRVREIVCSSCREQDTGICDTRENGMCALDSYFPTIVAVIEQEMKAEA